MTKRIDTLNALEEALAEKAAGEPITVIEDEKAPKVRMYCAIAWVIEKRDNPTLSFDDYLKTHRFRDALRFVFGDPEAEAEEAAAAAAAEEAGVQEDPAEAAFPEGGETEGAAGAPAAADAEGPVLPGDGAVTG